MLVETLRGIVGGDHVVAEPGRLAELSSDIFLRAGADFVLGCAPGSVDELSAAVAAATGAGHAVVPRGAGLSYTGGYTPALGPAVVFDMTRLDRIEINLTDSFVIVECGCTWKALQDALAPHGVRTPYLGPLSGAIATVGGALAQHAIYFGSTAHGTSAESVLGLEVILPDGRALRTGSWAQAHEAAPFFRDWGPDLTGLFLGDSGALGVKARACLRLIPLAGHRAELSFAYGSAAAMLTAMAAVARTGLAFECYGHNPWLTKLVRGAAEDRHTLNIALEAQGPATLAEIRDTLAALAAPGGEAIDAKPVRTNRETPFGPMAQGAVVGAEGLRVMPINTAIPHSRAAETEAAIRELMDARAEVAAAHRIEWGLSFFAVSGSAVVIDVLVRWYDAAPERPQTNSGWAHEREIGPATAAVAEIREALNAMLSARGAVNIQLGRAYPFHTAMAPVSWDLLADIKAALDPDGRINPGVLGLACDAGSGQ